jgi:hypothetical protein
MKVFILEESADPKKKFTAIRLNPTMKRISFGAKGYEDYTTHGDDERKKLYLARHKTREDWKDLDTPGAWSRWLLWNKKTLDASVKDMENRFGIKIAKAI